MVNKKLVILGSTGSIGVSALDVVAQNRDDVELVGLTGHTNTRLILEQAQKFHPRYIQMTDRDAWAIVNRELKGGKTALIPFEKGVEYLISETDADVVLNAIVGAAGLEASLATVRAGKRLALANKESMVIGGALINAAADESGAEIIPVDSEHSAIWQALSCGQKEEVRKIILTGSGGPFRATSAAEFANITKERALAHPTWNMGAKITIDSATMMNKSLEIIEAVNLFDISPDMIEIVIHPQSIIHSMVEFADRTIIAQMSLPDMRLPIAYAIFYPNRMPSDFGAADFSKIGKLTFEKPDFDKFPVLKTAFEIAATPGTSAAVFNAANEVAVAAFLNDIIKFNRISDIIINTVQRHKLIENPSLEDILKADSWARHTAQEMID